MVLYAVQYSTLKENYYNCLIIQIICNGEGIIGILILLQWDPKTIDISKEIEKGCQETQWKRRLRSDECIELLNQADIVVTNPPFSVSENMLKVLMDNNKDFVILGNMNAITYEVFPYIKENKIKMGYGFQQGYGV